MRGKTGGWFRLWSCGPGMSWTCEPPLYSERNGYKSGIKKRLFCIGKWRVFYLRTVPPLKSSLTK